MPNQLPINPSMDDYFSHYKAFTSDLGIEILNWASNEKVFEKDGTALKPFATKVSQQKSITCICLHADHQCMFVHHSGDSELLSGI
jgi:hypothetical protein